MLATLPGASHADTSVPLSTSRASIRASPDEVKAIEERRVNAVRWGATARTVAGASRSVPPTTLLGSATTMPAAIRYLASGGWVHS